MSRSAHLACYQIEEDHPGRTLVLAWKGGEESLRRRTSRRVFGHFERLLWDGQERLFRARFSGRLFGSARELTVPFSEIKMMDFWIGAEGKLLLPVQASLRVGREEGGSANLVLPLEVLALDRRAEAMDLLFRVAQSMGWRGYRVRKNDPAALEVELWPNAEEREEHHPYRGAETSGLAALPSLRLSDKPRPVPRLQGKADYTADEAQPLPSAPSPEQLRRDAGRGWSWRRVGPEDFYGVALSASRLCLVGSGGISLFDGRAWRKEGLNGCFTSVSCGQDGVFYAIGFVVGSQPFIYRSLYRSSDEGASWQRIALDAEDPLLGVWGNKDERKIVVVGDAGAIYVSSDDGESFGKKPTRSQEPLYGIAGRGVGALYAVGGKGTILRSSDWGDRWLPCQSGKNAALYGVWVSPQGEIYAVGEEATILHSKDGGASFRQLGAGLGLAQTLRAVWGRPATQDLYAAGDKGLILHSPNGGATWLSQESGVEEGLHGGACGAPFGPLQGLFIAGEKGKLVQRSAP